MPGQRAVDRRPPYSPALGFEYVKNRCGYYKRLARNMASGEYWPLAWGLMCRSQVAGGRVAVPGVNGDNHSASPDTLLRVVL